MASADLNSPGQELDCCLQAQSRPVLQHSDASIAGRFPIHLPRIECGRGAPCKHLRQLLLHSPEMHIARAVQRRLCTTVLEQIAQPHARPVCGAHRCWAPVEAHALLHYVLLLPPIACMRPSVLQVSSLPKRCILALHLTLIKQDPRQFVLWRQQCDGHL